MGQRLYPGHPRAHIIGHGHLEDAVDYKEGEDRLEGEARPIDVEINLIGQMAFNNTMSAESQQWNGDEGTHESYAQKCR